MKRVLESHEIDVHDDKIYHRAKRQISEEPIDINEDLETTFNTKLPDINVDCQEAIFQYLNFNDLLNIVDAHKDFLKAAGFIYSRLYKAKPIKINLSSCILKGHFGTHTIKSDCIELSDYRICSQFISNFGDRIKKLSIKFNSLNKYFFDGEVLAQTNKFCANSLVELRITDCQHFPSEAFTQPFTEVRCLSMTNCKLPFGDDELYRLFPCLNRLELQGNTVMYPSFIEHNIPELEHLSLNFKSNRLSSQNFLTALCYNQQLSSLNLMTRIDAALLHSISELSPNLRDLQFGITSGGSGDEISINFRSVEKLTLTTGRNSFKGVSITFDQLRELVIKVDDRYESDITDFITQNTLLTKLTIIAPSWNAIELTDFEVVTLGESLNLTELILKRCHISSNAASDLMNVCKMLRTFEFDQLYPEEELVLDVNDNWKWTIVNGSVQCERQ